MEVQESVAAKPAEKAEPKPEIAKAKPKKLHEADFRPTEAVQSLWTAYPPQGTTREDVHSPLFWAHVAKFMRPMAEIRVCPRDGKWYGIYLVTYVSGMEVRVEEIFFKVLDPDVAADLESAYYVKWVSPTALFGVIRKADGERVEAGFANKGEAMVWMARNEKRLRQ